MKKLLVFLSAILLVIGLSMSANAGLLGTYYNHTGAHLDMESPITGWLPGLVEPTLTGATPTLTTAATGLIFQFDWWNPAYQVFQRVDSDADFQSATFASSWFPVNTGNPPPDDPYYFAVYWTGQFYVDTEQDYTYSMGSDDDSWLFIDDQLILDLGGIHGVTYANYSTHLTQGYHDIDIFFAERHTVQSGFQLNFFSDLEPEPVPEPATMLLLGTGLVGLVAFRRRFRRR